MRRFELPYPPFSDQISAAVPAPTPCSVDKNARRFQRHCRPLWLEQAHHRQIVLHLHAPVTVGAKQLSPARQNVEKDRFRLCETSLRDKDSAQIIG